jgi:ATP-dependent Clp protease protease subunit
MLEYDPHLFTLDDEEEDKGNDKGKGDRSFAAKLLKSRTIIVSKQVDDKLAAAVFAQLRILEDDDPDKLITMIVNSPGGSADSGFAIMDYMRFVKPKVRSIVCGICASAAVMIHLGGHKDQRFCTPNSRFLLHQQSMSARGQASDLEILSNEIERIKEQYNKVVAAETGRSIKKIEADVHRDFWIPAEAAVEYGLVKKVIAHRGEIE